MTSYLCLPKKSHCRYFIQLDIIITYIQKALWQTPFNIESASQCFPIFLFATTVYNHMTKSICTKFISYRNGYYQGEVQENHKQGYGILLVDDGPIIVGQFKEDLLHGKAFSFINTEQYAYLQLNRGELEGYCVFRTTHQLFVVQFNNGRPIDRQLYINYDENLLKIMTYKNGSYDSLHSYTIQNSNEAFLSEKYFGLKLSPPALLDFLKKQFCNTHENFDLKELPNGEVLLKYNQPSNLLSLGFTIGRGGVQLNSFGVYLNDKLHGMGCKFDRNVKYQGIFQNGILNGLGMRLSNNRYSFGLFQKGNLIEAIHLQERTNNSLEKLRQLKKKEHIKSYTFFNGFIPKKIIRFRGILQITIGSSTIKSYTHSHSGQKISQVHSSSLKGSNVSLNQLLSGSRVQQVALDSPNKSILYSSQANKKKVEEQHDLFEESRSNRSGLQGGRFNH